MPQASSTDRCPSTTSSGGTSGTSEGTAGDETPRPRLSIPTIDLSSPGNCDKALLSTYDTNSGEHVFPRDAKTGEVITIPIEEIGKASRINDFTSGENGKCRVFEVVLQQREATICPFCARSPRRRRVPAHARGCFGLS